MNAGIRSNLKYTTQFLSSILLVHGGVVAHAEETKPEEFLYEITKDILNRVSNPKVVCCKETRSFHPC
jgi:hypothetical protein